MIKPVALQMSLKLVFTADGVPKRTSDMKLSGFDTTTSTVMGHAQYVTTLANNYGCTVNFKQRET
jgi:hypothetical protein